ncbi:MAG TPA: hypothetical protein VKK61_11880 [Tepidisphaeraceae bacterium]|nr:hypothetical protein [Tepidisphaeraceae bacterium]
MPVKVGCSQCGKQLNVKDEYLGRKLKCPQCGATFTAEIAKTSRAGKLSKPIAAKIHVSKGMIILIVCAIALPSLFAFWRYGPGRVMDDWQKALPDSEDRVKDVVTRGMQAYLSEQGDFDPTAAHGAPQALDIVFVFGPMHLSMPDKVGFAGSSTQGAFSGNYNPKNFEVEADVELGGLAFPGTGAIRRGNKTIHVTGRELNSVLSVEVNGQPAHVHYPKHD